MTSPSASSSTQQIASAPNTTPVHPSKQIIERSYDLIAPRYLTWTASSPSPRISYVNKLLPLLSSSLPPEILELGCGAGIPGTQHLAQRAKVTANDISPVQLALAAQNAPTATLIHSDMMSLSFPPASFDAVVAFYSIIHLPRNEQAVLMKRINRWVKAGGYFLGNFGTKDFEGSVRENWLGEQMFWSGWDEAGNREMVESAGWEILEATVVEQEEKGEESANMVPFLWILARKGEREAASEEQIESP